MIFLGFLERLKSAFFLFCAFSFTLQGYNCELLVSPPGFTRVDAVAGSNVTLAVSFSGAPDPVVTWFQGNLPVGTWTISSTSPPDIADDSKDVLRIEKNGSLTFVNVPLRFESNYTVEMTKSGLEKASTTFSLKIFEYFQDVTLNTQPDFAKEGADVFTLHYSMLQGVVEQRVWLFNGRELTDSYTHYLLEGNSLMILKPTRRDTGQYAVSLMNPFSSVAVHKNVTVIYGPDEPILEAHPAEPFYVAGASVSLSCQAEGFPQPSAEWTFGDLTFSDTHEGVLNLTHVQTSQGGVYTCTLLNELTGENREKSVTLNIYEKPLGSPRCSVLSVNNIDLQYQCEWTGGLPRAQLSFPALSTIGGAGNLSLTVSASDNLNEETVICMADHPVEQNTCNITASRPADFLPDVRTSVDSDGKVAVTILCVSEASPHAAVSWSKDGEAVTNRTIYQISSDTTQLEIRDYNITSFVPHNYTCTCRNPLGSKRRQIHLQGPSISDSSLFPNQDRTIITLTWEVPPTSVVTGFDIQLKGPDLLDKNGNITSAKGGSSEYRTIQEKPGSARSTDVFTLDPKLTYRFRVIPRARFTQGEPSEVHRIGPGEGLSGPAIAGIAAGIPCSILALFLLCFLIYLIIYCNKNRSHQTRYPVSRAVEKVRTAQPDITPHNRLPAGLKASPDYNRLQQTPSERSVALPTFVPPPPVRVATTV